MQWDAVVVWVCSAIMIICQGDTAPTVASLQTTYEREATPANTLHDKGLRLLEAKCDNGAAGRFLCQVTFLSTSDPAQRLYFDIIAVTRTTDGWALKSGLCKR